MHDVYFEFGEHPAVILSESGFNERLSHVVVAVITGTAGPASTHVPLGKDAGLTRYDVSYCDVTTVQPVDRYDVGSHRGFLSPGELAHVEELLRVYLGL